MKVLKNELYDFIDGSVNKELLKVSKAMNELIDNVVRNPIKAMIKAEYKPIATMLKNVYENYSKFIEHKGVHNVYKYQRGLGFLDSVANRELELSLDIIEPLEKYVKGKRLSVDMSDLPISAEAIEAAKKDCEVLQKKLADLETLRSELTAVVKASPSGKQAYNSLIALGVNMEAFKQSEAYLPAVQKLSVEPCLLNGGC